MFNLYIVKKIIMYLIMHYNGHCDMMPKSKATKISTIIAYIWLLDKPAQY